MNNVFYTAIFRLNSIEVGSVIHFPGNPHICKTCKIMLPKHICKLHKLVVVMFLTLLPLRMSNNSLIAL